MCHEIDMYIHADEVVKDIIVIAIYIAQLLTIQLLTIWPVTCKIFSYMVRDAKKEGAKGALSPGSRAH